MHKELVFRYFLYEGLVTPSPCPDKPTCLLIIVTNASYLIKSLHYIRQGGSRLWSWIQINQFIRHISRVQLNEAHSEIVGRYRWWCGNDTRARPKRWGGQKGQCRIMWGVLLSGGLQPLRLKGTIPNLPNQSKLKRHRSTKRFPTA